MTQQKSTAPEFFLNLGVVVTLYSVAASFLGLVFSIINKVFPDTLDYYSDPYSTGVRLSMATLIIVFPLFVWLSQSVTKFMSHDPASRERPVRRWMVYITLFFSSVMIVTDLVVLLNTFLAGEISTRFSLKVLAVLVVGGLVFWHYLGEARGTSSTKKYKITLYTSTTLVLVSVISAFFVFGSPQTIRKIRADDTRVEHLRSIQYQILNYWQQKGVVPEKLSELNDSLSYFSIPFDPETGAEYGYQKIGKMSFKLCGVFNLKNVSDRSKQNPGYAYPTDVIGVQGNVWNHSSGEVCFERTIDPDIYPVNKR